MINTRIGISLMSIVAALAMAGGAAFAAFSSTATSQNNTFAAGNMTLLINGANPLATGIFTISDAAPGDVFDQPFTLSNSGSVAISSLAVTEITTTPSNVIDDLGNVLFIQFYQDGDGDDEIDAGEALTGSATLNDPVWDGGVTLSGLTLGTLGSDETIKAKLTFDGSAGDEYQGENVGFSIEFTGNQ